MAQGCQSSFYTGASAKAHTVPLSPLVGQEKQFFFQEYRGSAKGSPCSCCFSGGLQQTEYWQAVKSIWGGPIPELNRQKLMHGFPLFQGKDYFQAKYCLKLHMTFTFASPEMIGKTIASNVFTKMRDLQ